MLAVAVDFNLAEFITIFVEFDVYHHRLRFEIV